VTTSPGFPRKASALLIAHSTSTSLEQFLILHFVTSVCESPSNKHWRKPSQCSFRQTYSPLSEHSSPRPAIDASSVQRHVILPHDYPHYPTAHSPSKLALYGPLTTGRSGQRRQSTTTSRSGRPSVSKLRGCTEACVQRRLLGCVSAIRMVMAEGRR
jgi:hypothetical protein